MRLFYSALLWLAEYELIIARSSGRSAASVEALQLDVARWQHALLMLQINAS
jgi:hypothetical protein